MNYGYEFGKLKSRVDELCSDIDRMNADFVESASFTDKFLNKCKQLGLSRVAVGIADQDTDGAKGWNGGYGMVFSNDHRTGTWPTIWKVIEDMQMEGGCGNSNQYQSSSVHRLVDGVYELKDGNWIKLR